VASTARAAIMQLRKPSLADSPSSRLPAARLDTGVTTAMTGRVIIGRPAWYAVWVSSSEHGPPSISA
jgi:hypothetical protein